MAQQDDESRHVKPAPIQSMEPVPPLALPSAESALSVERQNHSRATIQERRQHPRFSLCCPLTFTGDRKGTGILTNLGLGGCRLERAETVIEPRTLLSVRLHLGDGPPVNIDAAIVRWSTGRTLGLQFVHVAADAQRRLERYVVACPLPIPTVKLNEG